LVLILLQSKKNEELIWNDLKHIIISLINDYYIEGKKSVLNKIEQIDEDIPQDEVVKKINEILDTKIRPAVARDGGDIKFKSFKDGLVKVELKGSCSGCPSSMMTLKQGVQNLLCHYIPEVKNVEAL
jgi:Fe-S cluster biogenesis protein NfuA